SVCGQTRGKAQPTAIANELDNIRVRKRFAPDQSHAHCPKFANLSHPFFQVVDAWMRPAIVVFGAISAIEIATIRHVKAALQRFPIEKTLTGFHNVIAGKFAANFVEKLHAKIERFSLEDAHVRRNSSSAPGSRRSRERGQDNSLFV